MGAGTSTQERLVTPPQDIAEFRKSQGQDFYVIPEVPDKRKRTDFPFLIVFGICILILVPFLIYSLSYSDVDRFGQGYDKCGNICGRKNTHVDGIQCSGEDMTEKKLLQYKENPYRLPFKTRDEIGDKETLLIQDKCVSSCQPGYNEKNNDCIPEGYELKGLSLELLFKFLGEVARDLNRASGYIVGLCIIGLCLNIGMLFLFRYFTAVVVWVILIGCLFGIICFTGFLWYLNSTPKFGGGFLAVAIIFTIISGILLIVTLCLFKRIKLLIRLFKESVKVIFGIPLILFEPLLSLIAKTILFIVGMMFLARLGNAGILQEVHPDFYDYVPNVAMIFTVWYHIIIVIWMGQFIIGCEHMVISGSVSAYYFARDKSTVQSPIYNSFYNLLKYHLGTVALGSLILTAVAVIKELIRSLINSKQAKILVDCCLGAIEDFLKYLSKNAYIQTAIHGQPFFKSGKRAVRLLAANALSAIAVNSVGNFVLGMAVLLTTLGTVFIGVLMYDHDIMHFWAAIVVAALVTLIIGDCIFTVFLTAVDTLFICFCEDSCMNDGMARPYYMSVNLMKYVEDAKALTPAKN